MILGHFYSITGKKSVHTVYAIKHRTCIIMFTCILGIVNKVSVYNEVCFECIGLN